MSPVARLKSGAERAVEDQVIEHAAGGGGEEGDGNLKGDVDDPVAGEGLVVEGRWRTT